MMATCRCQQQLEAIWMPRKQALGGVPQEAEGILRLQTSW